MSEQDFSWSPPSSLTTSDPFQTIVLPRSSIWHRQRKSSILHPEREQLIVHCAPNDGSFTVSSNDGINRIDFRLKKRGRLYDVLINDDLQTTYDRLCGIIEIHGIVQGLGYLLNDEQAIGGEDEIDMTKIVFADGTIRVLHRCTPTMFLFAVNDVLFSQINQNAIDEIYDMYGSIVYENGEENAPNKATKDKSQHILCRLFS